LIQMGTPGLESLGSACETEKAFKTILARVHPDKHPQDTPRSTRLCQDAQHFCDKCLSSSPSKSTKKHSSATSPTSTSFPLEFNATNKWPHIEYNKPHAKPELTQEGMSRVVAYQCINARGAIAHGKKTQSKFSNEQVSEFKSEKDVKQTFANYGGAKELNFADEIKAELMKNGPVVSTSFQPSDIFLSNHAIGQSDHCHQGDILIVGWKQLSSGEVWIVQPLYHDGGLLSQIAFVAVGQFGLEDCCLAPMDDFEDTPWQSGPYYDADLTAVEGVWQTWLGLNVYLKSMSELDSLFKEMGTALFSNSSHVVTVRNKRKKAHSRKATLNSSKWNETKKSFQVGFTFCE